MGSALQVPAEPAARVLGRAGRATGPTLIVTAGIHGNEPAGVRAAERVLAELQRRDIPLGGEIVALIGNRAGLAREARFLVEDLNRLWTAERLTALRTRPSARDHSEEHEQRELLSELEPLLAREQVTLLDLHSTSGGGPPFALAGDTLQNRRVAFALQVPFLLGLEENVSGTLVEHVGALGHVAVVIEGGQSRDPRTADVLESALWITLVSSGVASACDIPDLELHRARLRSAARGLPAVIEVAHRHDIAPEDERQFEMLPGFEGFARVERGTLLAHSGGGRERPVHAPFSGLLLMPRYQSQGRDGFFLGRSVSAAWLALSAALRRLHLERLLGLLPGVRVDARGGHTLTIDRRIARFFAAELFHLLGYRRREERGHELVVTRRNDRL
jgi:succinylglutamate desuccinylase